MKEIKLHKFKYFVKICMKYNMNLSLYDEIARGI